MLVRDPAGLAPSRQVGAHEGRRRRVQAAGRVVVPRAGGESTSQRSCRRLFVFAILLTQGLLGLVSSGVGAATTIRIGLLSDLDEWTLPCCGSVVSSASGDEAWRPRSPARIRAMLGDASAGRHTVQVAALRDEFQAERMAQSLAAEFAAPGSVSFDAAEGLFKVRLGSFVERPPAEILRDGLALRGYAGTWVVSEATLGADAGIAVDAHGQSKTFDGRWLRIENEGGVRVQGARYRGTLLLFVNERGRLNLINELPLEDYLRGVVPKELGPASYPHLEALKAQSIAARTYALSQLGGFAAEGFDLCATPRCQVYGGILVEHPLSDQAVLETQGEVLWFDDGLAETLYSATCGGHTEDVERVFPQRSGAHLVGVPCVEGGVHRLTAALPRADLLTHIVDSGLYSLPGVRQEAPILEKIGALAELAGLPGLAAARGEHVLAHEVPSNLELGARISRLFDLKLDHRLIALPPTALLTQLVQEARAHCGLRPRRGELAAEAQFDGADEKALLLALALRTGLLEFASAQHLSLGRDRLVVRLQSGRGGTTTWKVLELERPSSFALFEAASDGGVGEALELATLVPGDELRLVRRDGVAIAAIVPPQLQRMPQIEDRGSWRRFRSDRELADLVAQRVPGFALEGIDVLKRGSSGRVTEVRLHDDSGQTVLLEGLVIRWTFDLPDTLFSLQRIEGERPGYLFSGRGWGHGVGLCQVGAVGMAQYGHSYRQILRHYYGGAEVVAYGSGGVAVGGAR